MMNKKRKAPRKKKKVHKYNTHPTKIAALCANSKFALRGIFNTRQ